MRKIFHDLYEDIYNPLNLWWAYKYVARGKRYMQYDLEKNLIEIEQELKDETYQLGGY